MLLLSVRSLFSTVLTLLQTKNRQLGSDGQWTLTHLTAVLGQVHTHRFSPVYACQQLAPHLNNFLHLCMMPALRNLLDAMSHADLQPINAIFAFFQPDPAALLPHAADRVRPFQLLLVVAVGWVGGALAKPHQDAISQITQHLDDSQDFVQQTQTQQQQQPARAPQGPASSAAAIPPVACPTAPDVRTLASGAELGSVEPGKTYLLQAGTYTISSTLQLNTTATTCFRGAAGTASQFW